MKRSGSQLLQRWPWYLTLWAVHLTSYLNMGEGQDIKIDLYIYINFSNHLINPLHIPATVSILPNANKSQALSLNNHNSMQYSGYNPHCVWYQDYLNEHWTLETWTWIWKNKRNRKDFFLKLMNSNFTTYFFHTYMDHSKHLRYSV